MNIHQNDGGVVHMIHGDVEYLILGIGLLVFVGYQLATGRYFYWGMASQPRSEAPVSYWVHLGIETAVAFTAINETVPLVSIFQLLVSMFHPK